MAKVPQEKASQEFHCYRCGKTQAASEFTWRANGSRFSACKACNRTMAKERRARIKAGLPAANPEFDPRGSDDE